MGGERKREVAGRLRVVTQAKKLYTPQVTPEYTFENPFPYDPLCANSNLIRPL